MRLSYSLALLALVALVSADARRTGADERSLDEKLRVLLVAAAKGNLIVEETHIDQCFGTGRLLTAKGAH